MFIRLLRPCRHLFLALPLALLQSLEFCLALLAAHGLCEENIVEKHQVFVRPAGGEHHALEVLSTCVHLQLKDGGHAHLILKDRGARHTLTHQMPAAADRALQHHQPNLVLLRQYQLPDSLRLRCVVAVHVVEEEAALALATRQRPVGIADVVGQLQQLRLCLAVAIARLGQQPQVRLRVPERHQLLAVLDGAGHLPLAPAPLVFVSYLIYHTYFLPLSNVCPQALPSLTKCSGRGWGRSKPAPSPSPPQSAPPWPFRDRARRTCRRVQSPWAGSHRP